MLYWSMARRKHRQSHRRHWQKSGSWQDVEISVEHVNSKVGNPTMIVLIDNYDSFTYNLAQAFGLLGADVQVYRNDALTVPELEALGPSHIIISPGPGNPDDGGISLQAIRELGPKIPTLGVCL